MPQAQCELCDRSQHSAPKCAKEEDERSRVFFEAEYNQQERQALSSCIFLLSFDIGLSSFCPPAFNNAKTHSFVAAFFEGARRESHLTPLTGSFRPKKMFNKCAPLVPSKHGSC
jgi:hypothetical protein